MTIATTGDDGHAPLLSTRLLTRMTIGVAVLAGLTIGISITGRMLGERIALAGHTENAYPVDIVIGQDQIRLPANVIRFEEQRRTGLAERVDLYLTWPEMQGYSNTERSRFNDANRPESLLFLSLSQSTMSKDMSGRLEPIYTQLFDGPPIAYGHGLTLHRLKNTSGYGEEVLLTAERPGKQPFVVRCLLPSATGHTTSGDCQREKHIGRDLTTLYRFSSSLLKDWDHSDAAVHSFVDARLDATGSNSASKGD
jgi:hypothetical protein